MSAIASRVNMSKRKRERSRKVTRVWKIEIWQGTPKGRQLKGERETKGGACKTNNKEKREASSTGKLPGSSKNIHKQTTNTRAEVAGDDVSSGAESCNCCCCRCFCCKCCQDANWKIDCTLNWLQINCKQRQRQQQQQPWQEHLQQPTECLLAAKLLSNIYHKKIAQNTSRNEAAHCRQIDALLMKLFKFPFSIQSGRNGGCLSTVSNCRWTRRLKGLLAY